MYGGGGAVYFTRSTGPFTQTAPDAAPAARHTEGRTAGVRPQVCSCFSAFPVCSVTGTCSAAFAFARRRAQRVARGSV
ncbi:hypothetical protein a10_07356 [Streptomyces acidiscabies]|nr:hypothetical protein a10_07356 [Streptomyces acidiscabies]